MDRVATPIARRRRFSSRNQRRVMSAAARTGALLRRLESASVHAAPHPSSVPSSPARTAHRQLNTPALPPSAPCSPPRTVIPQLQPPALLPSPPSSLPPTPSRQPHQPVLPPSAPSPTPRTSVPQAHPPALAPSAPSARTDNTTPILHLSSIPPSTTSSHTQRTTPVVIPPSIAPSAASSPLRTTSRHVHAAALSPAAPSSPPSYLQVTVSADATIDVTPMAQGGSAPLRADSDVDDDDNVVFVSQQHVPRRSTRNRRQPRRLDVSAPIGMDRVGDEEADLLQPALWPPADTKYRVCVPSPTSVLYTSLDRTTCSERTYAAYLKQLRGMFGAEKRPSSIHRSGLFAVKAVPAGKFLIEYTGIRRTGASARALHRAFDYLQYICDLSLKHNVFQAGHHGFRSRHGVVLILCGRMQLYTLRRLSVTCHRRGVTRHR